MAKRIAILGTIIAILGGLPSAFYWWPSPTKAEFIKVKHRTIDHRIRWLLVDMNAAEQAMQNAKTNDNKLYWKRKVNTIQIQLNQLIKKDVKN
jgi:predicted outer membrane protein